MTLARTLLSSLEKNHGRLTLRDIHGSARAFLLYELMSQGQRPIYLAKDHEEAESIYRDLSFFLGTRDELAAERGLLFLGADDKSPYEEYSPDPRAVMERVATLYRLEREPTTVRAVIVSPLALSRRLVPKEIFGRGGEYLVARETIDREGLLQGLVRWGYNAVASVEDPGTFSVRGGIVDVFSPYLPDPLRLDLFGDEIESIRCFDPQTQRTQRELDDAVILPAREIIYDDQTIAFACEQLEHLAEEHPIPTKRLDAVLEDIQNRIYFFGIECLLPLFHPGGLITIDQYLPKEAKNVFVVSDRDAMAGQWESLREHAESGYAHQLAHNNLAAPVEAHLADPEAVLERLLEGARVIELPEMVLGSPGAELALEVDPLKSMRAEILRAAKEGGENSLSPLTDRLKYWRAEGIAALLVAQSRGQLERLKAMLAPRGLNVRLREKPLDLSELDTARGNARLETGTLRDRQVHAWLVLGDVSSSFAFPAARIALVSEEDLFGQRVRKGRRRSPAARAFVSDLADLKPGDYVVHIDHGIGLYHGMTRLKVNGVDSDFLHIEYKGEDKLYLPVHRLALLQKYANAEDDRKPQLSRLGSPAWLNTKRKVKDTLLKMATELLRLYAMRASVTGFAFPPPDERYTQFEAEFPYEPTPDQYKAILDVKKDLESGQPMDRLIAGDVGYGKTEVAIRAAMLGYLAKKQVAVLVPTTVLAAQHHQVFKDRMANFEARVEIISRFQTNEEVKKTLAGLASGQVDIVIGTHRLLSKDVKFKDLGLLVIDEEHRFGVKHKEALKKYRAKVHVLSMSATPIPRTLNMSFLGVRDMSVIATPPVDRLAVKTEVHRFSEEVIRDAIVSEIRRGGQCFVVHNRVASIAAFGQFIEKLVPEARVLIGHGQMDEELLEQVMVRFMRKEFNVLVSTTIIESGIDIPNANTIIVNRADRFGLAQLYQLRGRVGRGKARGYSHFLIPAGNLSKDARKRINVLQRFTELGAGFKVASHDLEIRGAGNILGQAQHGSIGAVGFEMYQQLMGEAIEELKGQGARAMREPEINVPVPALIPDNYVPPPGERLSYYQRFNRAQSDEATYDLIQELTDLYGAPPPETENMAQLMMTKQRMARLGLLSLDYGPPTKAMAARIVLRFDANEGAIDPARLVAFVQQRPIERKLVPDGRLMIFLKPFDESREILLQSKDLLDALILAQGPR